MHFDKEGHIVITPREWERGLADISRLTRDVWLVGTPWAFHTYEKFRDFLVYLADRFGVHPNNIAVRGSTKIGFSISPRLDKVWVGMHLGSDLDLAIVDTDYYHFLDREIRTYERRMGSRLTHRAEYRKTIGRQTSRKFYHYRYQDLPDIGCVRDHLSHLSEAPVEHCCGCPRTLTAFVYRDWWSVHGRCEYDLRDLRKAMTTPGFPPGEDAPRRSALLLEGGVETPSPLTEGAVVKRSCENCGGDLQLAIGGQNYFCPRCCAQPDGAE